MGPNQQYGIKLAQPGFDVRTCKDYNLIFNSSWPSLAIVYDQLITVTYDSFGSPTPSTVTHNLGYYPLTMAWQFSDSTMTTSLGRPPLGQPNVAKNVFLMPTGFAFSATVYFNIKSYNVDVSIPQQYNYLQPPAVNNIYDPTYGIKVSKQNLSIQSTDMRNFILHSRCPSPQVLAIVTEKTPYNSGTNTGYQASTNTLFYQNPQGYLPWVFAYGVVQSALTFNLLTYIWAPPNAQAYPTVFFTNAGLARLGLFGSPTGGSIVVLRDPLFVANSVSVVY